MTDPKKPMPARIWADRSDDDLPAYKDTPFGIWWHDQRDGYTEYAHSDEVEALTAERDAAATEVTVGEWQPIETAPRDGTPFLTFSTDARCEPQVGALGYQSTPVMVMAWIPSDKEPSPVNEHGDWEDWHCYDPTHWMPLPEPPALRELAGEKAKGGE